MLPFSSSCGEANTRIHLRCEAFAALTSMEHIGLKSQAQAAENATMAATTVPPPRRMCWKISPTMMTSWTQHANTSPYVLKA